MSLLFKSIVLGIWAIIGLYRYIEWEDKNGRGVDPELDGIHWYTILVHGPFWWLIKIYVLVSKFLDSLDWSWFERIFIIKKKGE